MSEPFKVELVCTGTFVGKGNKLKHSFRQVLPDGTLTKEDLCWDKMTGFPGTVYTVESESEEKFKATGSIRPNTLRWARAWENKEDVLKWQAESRAVSVQHEAEKRKGKEKELFDELKKVLRPVRLLYARTNPQGKAAITAIVIRILMADPRFENIEEEE